MMFDVYQLFFAQLCASRKPKVRYVKMFSVNAKKVSPVVWTHEKNSPRFNRFQQKIFLVERMQINIILWFYQLEWKQTKISIKHVIKNLV